MAESPPLPLGRTAGFKASADRHADGEGMRLCMTVEFAKLIFFTTVHCSHMHMASNA